MIIDEISRARFTAALCAVLAATPAVARAQARPKLRVGTLPIDNGAEIFYALERGAFAKTPFDVDLQVMTNGGAIVAAVASGALDIGFSNLFSIVTAFSKGIPIAVIAPAALYDASSPAQALIVRDDAPLHSAKDLSGKVLAVDGLKGITQVTAAAWIDANGGDSTTVRFIEVPGSLMVQALLDKRVDCASSALSDAPGAGTHDSPVRILAYPYSAIAERFLASGWFSAKPWAADHADLARSFADAIVASGKWANANKAKSATMLATYTKMTPERIALIAKNRAVYGTTPLHAADLEPVISFSAKHNIIANAFPAQSLAATL